MVTKMSEGSSLSLYRDIHVRWGTNSMYIEFSTKIKWMAWLLEVMWKLGGTGKKTNKEICALCLGEDDIKHVLLSCS
jgi:hypothetical protein